MVSKDTVRFHHVSLYGAQQKYRAFYQKMEKFRNSLQDSCNTETQFRTIMICRYSVARKKTQTALLFEFSKLPRAGSNHGPSG